MALLLAFFAAGVLLGLLAMLGTWLAQRREIARLQRIEFSRTDAKARLAVAAAGGEG